MPLTTSPFQSLILASLLPKDIVLWGSHSPWHILMILSFSCSCWCQTHLWLYPPWRLHIDLTESWSYSLGLDFSVSFYLLKWDVLDSKPRRCWSRALCDSFISFSRFFSHCSSSAHLSFGKPWYCSRFFSLGLGVLMAPLLKCLWKSSVLCLDNLYWTSFIDFFKKSVFPEYVLIAWSTS